MVSFCLPRRHSPPPPQKKGIKGSLRLISFVSRRVVTLPLISRVIPGRRVTSQKFGWGYAAHSLKRLPYFKPQCVIDFPYPIDLTQNSIPYLRWLDRIFE